MKFVSWNVNGLRACLGKGFLSVMDQMDADVFCLQEIKLSEGQLDTEFPGYHTYWNYAEKKGYSGTAVFSKSEPLSVIYGIGKDEHDHEGRVITLEFDAFFLTTVYVPNSQNELARLSYRREWNRDFCAFISNLDKVKPVVFCGDFNVAHQEIDIKNPSGNRKNPGFTDEEREDFSLLLQSGFTDTWRSLHPDTKNVYSWWSYRFHARENNAGWRIDYFLISDRLSENIVSADIHTDIMGSDHCPISLNLSI